LYFVLGINIGLILFAKNYEYITWVCAWNEGLRIILVDKCFQLRRTFR